MSRSKTVEYNGKRYVVEYAGRPQQPVAIHWKMGQGWEQQVWDGGPVPAAGSVRDVIDLAAAARRGGTRPGKLPA
jgi:hypothetical protein